MVQKDNEGKNYVCAYASTGLTSAQKIYYIVHLELLAFVYACGKFYDWLSSVSFVWLSDYQAYKFLHEAKVSPNQTIASYMLALAEFDFKVEWIPGVTMIADAFSRIVMLPEGRDALTFAEIVFGPLLGKQVLDIKEGRGSAPLLWFSPVVPFHSLSVVLCKWN